MTTPIKLPTDTNSDRVNRSGGWVSFVASGVRAANRYWNAPADRYFDLGFRTTQTGCRQPLKG